MTLVLVIDEWERWAEQTIYCRLPERIAAPEGLV
jgi:hypothetical protein